ncbi:MAG: DegV family protein [Clostridiaceae bacterium]|nr:DegV family protein [Clostridiaceae bacterium]
MVRIMSDTSSLFTPKTGLEAGVDIIPLTVTIAGKTYREMVDIEPMEFLSIIRQGNLPTSSQPSPGDTIEIYSKATEEEPILHITMADGLSGSYSTACSVREDMPNKEYITVINSRTLCGPEGAIVRKAIKLAQAGKTVAEIISRLAENIESSKSFLIPQDFGYLKRGGRLSPTAANVGGLLKLVPVLCQSDDGLRLNKAAVCRNFTKAVEKCIEGFKRIGVDERCLITISHADNFEQGSYAYTMMSDSFNGAALELVELTPAFITQGGPLCVAIQAVLRV